MTRLAAPEVSAALCRPREVVRLARHDMVRAVPAIHAMSGYWLALATPYRSGSIHEIPYHASPLVRRWRPGRADLHRTVDRRRRFRPPLCPVGYRRGAGARPTRLATVTMGGNDVIAWEVAPGTIAYLGLQRRAESGPHRQRAAATGQPRASAVRPSWASE
jgi:hypothetical protein